MSRNDDINRMLSMQKLLQENKLKANNHKGGWGDMRPAEILFRAEQEMEELRDAVRELMRAEERGARALLPKLRGRVLDESTDVADFMGFMVDTVGEHAPVIPADEPSEAQDDIDMAVVASTHLVLARCPNCHRLTRESFECVHCDFGTVYDG